MATPAGRNVLTTKKLDAALVLRRLSEIRESIPFLEKSKRPRSVDDGRLECASAEEFARDPENAHLVPHVEKMREAYLSSYGRPIPSRPKE